MTAAPAAAETAAGSARLKPGGAAARSRDFDSLHATVSERLEATIALVGMAVSGLLTVMLLAMWLAGKPIIVGNLGLGAGGFVIYSTVRALIRAGWYRPWFRYVMSGIEVTIPTLVALLDHRAEGPLGVALGGGTGLYALVVAASTLRLDPRICIFAGGLGTVQYLAVTLVHAPPASDPRVAALFTATPVVTLIKGTYILGIGVLGMTATIAMRRLILRLTKHAVERERVRSLFSLYVSEEIVEQILAGKVKAGGERRRVTVLFSDIRGFTTLAEARPPEEVLRLLNLYFDRMCEVVARHQGVVNKFMGDGMLVVFGAPNTLADDARRALAAAKDMLAEAARLAASREFPGLRIGIGLHRGDAVVGNVGGTQRQEYTVIGDTVNTASRVEGLAKSLDRSLLLTAEVRAAIDGEDLESLGVHIVRGRGLGVELFAPRP